MAVENGNAFILTLDVKKFEGETSTGISYSANLVEATTKITGGYAEYIPGVQSATIQFEKLHTFNEVLEVGSKFVFHVGPRTKGFAGECIIDSVQIDSSSDSVQTYSGTASVTGEAAKFIPIYGEEIFCTTDGREICTTDGRQLYVNVLTN